MAGVENEIPDHREGVATNTESSKDFSTEDEAKKFYHVVRERLFSVNEWHEFAGSATAHFRLTDTTGHTKEGPPVKDDFFEIAIPAPGPKAGDGKDWVQVESVTEDENGVSITVRPASAPVNDEETVAHFFGSGTTSTFQVKREGLRVVAGVYGRNEKPNLETGSLKDTLRNAAVAVGAISGFSKIQWKSLVNGLIK